MKLFDLAFEFIDSRHYLLKTKLNKSEYKTNEHNYFCTWIHEKSPGSTEESHLFVSRVTLQQKILVKPRPSSAWNTPLHCSVAPE
jgi:hypothetical protein